MPRRPQKTDEEKIEGEVVEESNEMDILVNLIASIDKALEIENSYRDMLNNATDAPSQTLRNVMATAVVNMQKKVQELLLEEHKMIKSLVE